MKLLNVNFATLIMRFYLIMAIVIVSFFIGMPWLSMLALPVFAITLLGITFGRKKRDAGRQPVTTASNVPVTGHQVSH